MRPRNQRYAFEHLLIGGLVAWEPTELWPRLQADSWRDFFRELWRQAGGIETDAATVSSTEAGEAAPKPFPKLRVAHTTVAAHDVRHLTLLIEFPRPEAPPDAFFGAIVWRRPPRSIDWDDPRNPLLHPLLYFTLESAAGRGPEGTCTAGWRLDENDRPEHVNFGPGPPVDPLRFLAEIGRLLDEM